MQWGCFEIPPAHRTSELPNSYATVMTPPAFRNSTCTATNFHVKQPGEKLTSAPYNNNIALMPEALAPLPAKQQYQAHRHQGRCCRMPLQVCTGDTGLSAPHWASIPPMGLLLLSIILGWAMAGAIPLLKSSRPLKIKVRGLLREHSLAVCRVGGKSITEGGRSKSCAVPLPTHHIVFLQQSYSRGFLWCQTLARRRAKKIALWKRPVCSFPQALARRSLKSYTCKKI